MGVHKRKRRSFTKEFKAETVRLVGNGRSIPEVARELDLTESALRNWVRQTEVDAGHGAPGELTTEEREELRRLRREVKSLREDREILKKAALDSTSQRNTLVQHFCGRTEFQRLPRALVQSKSNPVQIRLRVGG